MSKYLITIGNETREMTEAEITQLKKDQQDFALEQQKIEKEIQAKADAKAAAKAKLAKLGLTADDLKALGF